MFSHRSLIKAMASSTEFTVMIGSNGPKIYAQRIVTTNHPKNKDEDFLTSSCMIGESALVSTKTVGAM